MFRESGTYPAWIWHAENGGAPYVGISATLPNVFEAANAYAIEVFYVQTDPCAVVNPLAIVGVRLPHPARCQESYIVTSPLSGCTLVFSAEDGISLPEMAHIHPYRVGDPFNVSFAVPPEGQVDADTETISRAGLAGASLQNQLNEAPASFGDQPIAACRTFGRRDYRDYGRVNIIGVKTPDRMGWTIYAQCMNSSGDLTPAAVAVIATLRFPAG